MNIYSNNMSRGSLIAKAGYREEMLVINDLNQNKSLRKRLLNWFECVDLLPFQKSLDRSKIDIYNNKIRIQIKKYKNNQFGQIDRRYVSNLIAFIPKLKSIEKYLIGMCELPLVDGKCDKSKSVIKLNNTNYLEEELIKFIKTLNEYKMDIITYALCGIGCKGLDLICGSNYTKANERNHLLFYKIKDVIEHLNTYDFKIRPSGTVIELGPAFTLQRKGGDNGKKEANHLQFKLVYNKLDIKNCLLYNITNNDVNP